MQAALPPDTEKALRDRFLAVRARLEHAARASGRKVADVQLVAVSKFHPAALVAALAAFWSSLDPAVYGRPAFGENYVQEALDKQGLTASMLHSEPALSGPGPEWHFIGHLQSRKAREAAGRFSLIHTVDSLKLARNLQKVLAEPEGSGPGTPQAVLVQVNLGREAQKAGIAPEEAPALLAALREMRELSVQGLMCIPPFGGGAEASRPYFAGLRELRDSLAGESGLALPQLSMGMSHDFELAISEGATIVRVGTDLFGARPPRGL
jgi:pyridoxal phosphate enzyme (YggS family)